MKTHAIWLCVSLAAFLVGTRFTRKEVRVVERPVEVVRTKEVLVERPPVERRNGTPQASEKIAPPALAPPMSVANKVHSPFEQAKLHRRYDPFLTELGLSSEQMNRFVELKLAIYEAQDDLQAAVVKHGGQGGTASVEAMRTQLTKPMWDEIRQLLGETGFKAYGDYEQTSAFLPTVTSLFEQSGTAISVGQQAQLTQLVIKNTQSYRANPTDIGTRAQTDWAAVARDAEPILTPEQIAVVRARAAREPMRQAEK